MSLEILDEYIRLNEEHKNQIKSQRKLADKIYDCIEISLKVKYSFILIIPIFYFLGCSLLLKGDLNYFSDDSLYGSYFLLASYFFSVICSIFYVQKINKNFIKNSRCEKLKLRKYNFCSEEVFACFVIFYIVSILFSFICNNFLAILVLLIFLFAQFILNTTIVLGRYFIFKSKNGKLKRFFISGCKNKIKLDISIEKNILKIKKLQNEILNNPEIIEKMLVVYEKNKFKSKVEKSYYISIFNSIKDIKKEQDKITLDVENWRQDLNKTFNKEIKTENQKNIIIENN